MNTTLRFKTTNELSIFMVPADDIQILATKIDHKLPSQEVLGKYCTLTVRPESNLDYFRGSLRFTSMSVEDANQIFDLLHRLRKIFSLNVVGIQFNELSDTILCEFPVECVAYEDFMEILERL